jgi:hypothetical protein
MVCVKHFGWPPVRKKLCWFKRILKFLELTEVPGSGSISSNALYSGFAFDFIFQSKAIEILR